jgi:hypothetical protein
VTEAHIMFDHVVKQGIRTVILNVGMSDVKMHRCEGVVSAVVQQLYLKLDLLGRCIQYFSYYISLMCR